MTFKLDDASMQVLIELFETIKDIRLVIHSLYQFILILAAFWLAWFLLWKLLFSYG